MISLVDLSQTHGMSDSELESIVGNKAADLITLGRDAKLFGAQVPAFRLIPFELIEPYASELAGRTLSYSQIPAALDTPTEVRATSRAFSCALMHVLAGMGSAEPLVLRTSIRWPAGGVRRPPGVDVTRTLASGKDAAGAAPLFAGLYKAYTSCCLRWSGVSWNVKRTAAVILMDRVDVAVEGIAYLRGGVRLFELSAHRGTAFVGNDLEAAIASRIIDRDSAMGIEGPLRRMAAASEGGILEVEFLVDTSSRVFFIQRSRVEGARDGMVFHTPGAVEGDVVDLRGLERSKLSRESLRRMLTDASDRIVVLPLLDGRNVDAFALFWLIVDSTLPVLPKAFVLTHAEHSQSGLPTHLRWTLANACPDSLFFRIPESALPESARHLQIASDGVSIRWVA